MKISCPRCAQRISLDARVISSLAGAAGFDCPACGGHVPLPSTDDDSDAPTRMMDDDGAGQWQAPPAEEVARTFDQRYRIGHLLGRGGMGAVYEGFDTRLDRRVAVKILPAETVGDAAALARFEREAKTMAALDHPNIVHIHDYGCTADGHPYLVMEFIDGMDIHALRQSGQLDLPSALEIISQVCSALHYAHARGIVHRDIKPANILITRDGVAKVGDFGLAKVLGSDSRPRQDPTLTETGAAMGTPDYMAPEQMEGRPVDHRADIYSLGVMLYDLLTGGPPRGAWPPPSQRVHIDVRLDEIVLRALQQNPSSRYQAASEIRLDIDSVKSSTGGGPLPPGTDPEPLPSTRGTNVADARRTTSAPAASMSRPRSEISPGDILATTRSINTTMLTLGLLALATIGGLALFLAHRKTGDTYSTQQTITNSVTNNTYLTQIIAAGLASADDLAAIGDIRPRGDRLIGIGKEPLAWDRAQDLAKKTGALILPLDAPSGGVDEDLVGWLRESFASQLSSPVWVTSGGTPHRLEGDAVQPADDLAASRKVLLIWALPPTTEDAEEIAPSTRVISPSPERDFTFTSHGTSVTITGYVGKGGNVVVPSSIQGQPVTWIAQRAFYGVDTLTSLALPDGLVAIEGYAFQFCRNLSHVSIPEGVTDIGTLAFGGSLRLERVVVPRSVRNIGWGAFAACPKLREIVVADGNSAFRSVDGVLFDSSMSTLMQCPGARQGAFLIPDSVTSLACDAFNGCEGLNEITIPRSVSRIPQGTFAVCTGLRRVTIPASVTAIDWHAFQGCRSLRTIRIPRNVRSLGGFAFEGCSNLEAVIFEGDAPKEIGPDAFGSVSARFTIEFQPGSDGFTSPVWQGYPARKATPPSWTSKDGKTIHATFLKQQAGSIVVLKDGKEFTIPLEKLSDASVAQAKTLAKEAGEFPE